MTPDTPPDDESADAGSDDSETEDDDDGMTREELDELMREHLRKRESAYVKMGTVDIPPDERG